eukprot:2524304-Amphidinium_carterae.1
MLPPSGGECCSSHKTDASTALLSQKIASCTTKSCQRACEGVRQRSCMPRCKHTVSTVCALHQDVDTESCV